MVFESSSCPGRSWWHPLRFTALDRRPTGRSRVSPRTDGACRVGARARGTTAPHGQVPSHPCPAASRSPRREPSVAARVARTNRSGGERGIRTLGAGVTDTRDFQSRRISHSRISPQLEVRARSGLAERVGFEPTVPFEYNGFRDRPIQPLSHLSATGNVDCTSSSGRDRWQGLLRAAVGASLALSAGEPVPAPPPATSGVGSVPLRFEGGGAGSGVPAIGLAHPRAADPKPRWRRLPGAGSGRTPS